MRRWLLATLIMLFGCGADDQYEAQARNKVYKVGQFEPYVKLFELEAARRGQNIQIDDLVIRFKRIPDDTPEDGTILAQCWLPTPTRAPTIDVDPDRWQERTFIGRMILLFHEMGHCILMQDHRDELSSIMNTYILSNITYAKYENYFMDELFNPEEVAKMNLNKTKNKRKNKKGDRCSQSSSSQE